MCSGILPLWLAGVGREGSPELEKKVMARLGRAWDLSGTLGIAQGRMGNALRTLNYALESSEEEVCV